MSKFAKKPALAASEEKPVKAAKVTKLPTAVAKGAKTTAKGDKPVKAAKPAKAAKAEKKERITKSDERKITNVVKENPHREGTGRYEAYEAVKKAKRVSDYLEAGHKPKYLAKWDEQGLITLSE